MSWAPEREAGCARLEAFLPNAGRRYAALRNYDFGPEDRSNISALSPYLRHRLVLEEEVLRATLRRHGAAAAQKFIQEVFWRTYYKGWMEQRPQVWTRYRAAIAKLVDELNRDSALHARYEGAVHGRTGIDCLDAWARELVATGYLHNHARRWFASIWIFTLGLPWQLGADFFYRHLLDGDPASNTLSWRWVGGLHTRGKTYLARASNIARYTRGRFHPAGQLAAAAPALSEPRDDQRQPLPATDSVPSSEPFGLLVTEEDCAPETLPLPQTPVSALGLSAGDTRSLLPTGKPARDFAEGALADALARASRHYSIEAVQSATSDWETALIEWARRERIDTIVTAYATLGPVAERLASARASLATAGIRLVQVRRPYDEAAWPHATKGFFALKAKIPAILSALGIGT